jgi:hypothetical protein
MDPLLDRVDALAQPLHTLLQTRPTTRQLRWWRGMALVFVTLATWTPVQAAVLPCPAWDVACLIAAIQTANGNGEADTIQLEAGTYLLTAVDHETEGPNGLPSITSPITITGAGAETTVIERDVSAPAFRILHITAAGTLTLDGLSIQGGLLLEEPDVIPPFGPGIFNNGGTVSLTHSTIANNAGPVSGGIHTTSGTVTITQSTLIGNEGGAIINQGSTVSITQSTLIGNEGGGIWTSGTMTITQSTLADNRAVESCGAILNVGGTVELLNTMLARNTALLEAPDSADPITSLGHNLIGDVTDCEITVQPSDRTGPPGLGSLIDDGTPGHAHLPLLASSPAINAGDPEVCAEDPQLATDQLGQPRVGSCDIGAVEFQALVGDTIPPAVTMAVSPTTLWPPNGKLVSVQVSGTITDEADGSGVNASSAAFVVLDEYGEIQPHGSLTLGTEGQYAFTVALKASRKGNDRDGRHYTITVSATDQAGNLGGASTRVTVPHDQGQ